MALQFFSNFDVAYTRSYAKRDLLEAMIYGRHAFGRPFMSRHQQSRIHVSIYATYLYSRVYRQYGGEAH